MAKRYIDETGLKHVWSKCINLFAQKNTLSDYVKKDEIYDIVGNPDTAVQEVMEVSAEFNFNTGQAEKFSHTYAEIVRAFNAGKAVKLVANYLGDGDLCQYAIGDLIHYREDEKVLEFAVFVYSNILTVDHKLHHFRVVMNENNTTETTIEVLGSNGGGGGEDNDTNESAKEIMVVSADFSFETSQVTNVSHSYAEILQFAASEGLVKIKVKYSLPGNSRIYYAIGDLICISSYLIFNLQIETNIGAGLNMYLFQVDLYSDDDVTTKVRLMNTTDVN